MPDALLSLRFQNTSNRDLASHAVTYGVPLPEGSLRSAAGLAIRTAGGAARLLQTRVLETWLDGSIKWLLLDFDLPLRKNEKTSVDLVRAKAPAGRGVRVSETSQRITVTTPRLSVTLNTKRFSLFESYKVGGREMMAANEAGVGASGGDIVLEMPQGRRYYASNAKSLSVKVVEAGPQRVLIETASRHTAGNGEEMLTFRVRYEFRPNEPGVKVSYKFTNTEPPETGVKIGSIAVHVPTTLGRDATHVLRQANTGKHWFSRFVEVPENTEILAGGAVNEAAKARYGAASTFAGIVVVRDLANLRENTGEYPYYLRPGNARTDMTGGLRQVYPYIAMRSGPSAPRKASAIGFFLEMGYNFPKAVRADAGVLSFDIWPASAGDMHLRRGMSKEHDLYIAFADRTLAPAQLEGIYFDHEIKESLPVAITLDPDYVASCKVLQLHRWLRNDEKRYLAIETKLGTAGGRGDVSFNPSSRGMFDFGDYISPDRSWAHNNEDDAILNTLREYFRLEAPGRLRVALANARHNAHVDLIAFDPDPLRQGTMPAHCPEHTDGSTYPSHMWLDGLLAAYCVSGNEDFREAALSVGENMLRWQKDDPTIFYADSRECGWPALAFCRLYEHTKDKRWLRAIHAVFEHMREKVNDDAVILYELPHGVGTHVSGYGEFIAWRALFFYYELTGKREVKDFLIRCLRKVYLFRPGKALAGWACNDLFPCWALYQLTGEKQVLEDNYPFLRFLMDRKDNFPWGGNDMHFYLGELDRLGELEAFAK